MSSRTKKCNLCGEIVDSLEIGNHLKTFHPRCPICKVTGIEDLEPRSEIENPGH